MDLSVTVYIAVNDAPIVTIGIQQSINSTFSTIISVALFKNFTTAFDSFISALPYLICTAGHIHHPAISVIAAKHAFDISISFLDFEIHLSGYDDDHTPKY